MGSEMCIRDSSMLVPMWSLAALSIAIGINADVVVETSERAAQLLLGGGG